MFVFGARVVGETKDVMVLVLAAGTVTVDPTPLALESVLVLVVDAEVFLVDGIACQDATLTRRNGEK